MSHISSPHARGHTTTIYRSCQFATVFTTPRNISILIKTIFSSHSYCWRKYADITFIDPFRDQL